MLTQPAVTTDANGCMFISRELMKTLKTLTTILPRDTLVAADTFSFGTPFVKLTAIPTDDAVAATYDKANSLVLNGVDLLALADCMVSDSVR